MQLSAHIQTAIQMLDIFFVSLAPFDIIMAKFFRNNKWIGGSDRRKIAEFSYSIFRNFEKLKFFTSEITENFGRFYMLTYLKLEENLSDEKIEEIFCGKPHSPSKLTEFEERFIRSVDASKELPRYARL